MSILQSKPIHICIGQPRSGTTWLYNNLKIHPNIFCPPIKEVRYFKGIRGNQDKINNINFLRKFTKLTDEEETWLNAYEKSPFDSDNEYLNLMNLHSKQCSFDISPIYSIMNKEEIQSVHEVVGETTKVMLIIRNPINRALSQSSLQMIQHGNYRGSPDAEDLKVFLDNPIQKLRDNIPEMIKNWSHVFGKNFKYWEYEKFSKDPVKIYQEICDYLEINNSVEGIRENLQRNYGGNRGDTQLTLPKFEPNLIKTIYESRREVLEASAKQYPNFGKAWLLDAKNNIKLIDESKSKLAFKVEQPIVVSRLLRLTESIGDNCEYGFVQRSVGYEPASIFRWSVTQPEVFLDFLKLEHSSRINNIYNFENLVPYGPAMVKDGFLGICFHTQMKSTKNSEGALRFNEDDEARRKIYEIEKEKINFLLNRFDIQSIKPAIFVIKKNAGIDLSLINEIVLAVKKLNPKSKVLEVKTTKEPAQYGSVDEINENHYVGYLEAFAPYYAADDIKYDQWFKILRTLTKIKAIKIMLQSAIL